MKKANQKLDDLLTTIWGVVWVINITLFSLGVTIWGIIWILKLMGVM